MFRVFVVMRLYIIENDITKFGQHYFKCITWYDVVKLLFVAVFYVLTKPELFISAKLALVIFLTDKVQC